MTKNGEKDKPSAQKLLRWYDKARRSMPWRAPKGMTADPYHVLLSEVMLQQTTVTTVIPYFLRFTNRWPTVEALSKASLDDVNRLWAGLGYYRRARNLHACAQLIQKDFGGVVPCTEEALEKLPGIGPYTSAAIAAIAFDEKANVVDGNVERVMARVFAVQDPLPEAKKILRKHAGGLVPDARVGDYAQALMDLGATVCTPRNPKCDKCPWQVVCDAYAAGAMERFPVRGQKAARPVRYGTIFVLFDGKRRVLVRKRPDSGLLAGMTGFPGTPWEEKSLSSQKAVLAAPHKADWRFREKLVHHVFTHFELYLTVAVARIHDSQTEKVEGRWVRWQDCADEALPSVMRKVLKAALEEEKYL